MSGSDLRETLGLLAVVASLVFVGLEIRQTNQIARQEALRGVADKWVEVNMPMIVDERMALLNERVVTGEGIAAFDPADRQSVDLMFFTINHVWQTWYHEVRLGLLRTEDVRFPDPSNRFWNSEALRDVWPNMRSTYSEDFATFWEARFQLVRDGA